MNEYILMCETAQLQFQGKQLWQACDEAMQAKFTLFALAGGQYLCVMEEERASQPTRMDLMLSADKDQVREFFRNRSSVDHTQQIDDAIETYACRDLPGR